MEANLNKTLPQEGTGYLPAGESLGGPSGSSCPSYSGGGKDRFRHGVSRNGKTKQLTEIPESSRSSMTNSPGSDSTSSEDRIAPKAKSADSEIEKFILDLENKRLKMGNIEDQSTPSLQGHVIDGLVIIEKVASIIENPQERLILQDLSLAIKDLLVKTMTNETKRIGTRSQSLLLRRELAENKEIVSRSHGLKSVTNNSSSSEAISNGNLDVSVVKNPRAMQHNEINTANRTLSKQEDDLLTTEEDLEGMVQALQTMKLCFGKMDDQSSEFLQNYILDSVAIIKKVAIVVGDKDQLTLENAACDIKQAAEGLLKLSELTVENQLQMKKTPLEKEPQRSTKLPESLAPGTLDALGIKLDGDKLTNCLKKYLKDTIYEYLNDYDHKLLHDWEVQCDITRASRNNAHADTEIHNGLKRKTECRMLPEPEPFYHVWGEMDQFKDFAMKRIDRAAANKTSQAWFFEPHKGADAKVNKDLRHHLQHQPLWWTAEIAELRRVCMAARRQYSRSRRRRQRDEATEMELYAVYRSIKRELNTAVKRAKSEGKEVDDEDSEGS